MEVFKVQRPLAGSLGTEQLPFLIYTEGKAKLAHVPKEMVPEVVRVATMPTGKCYVRARIVGGNKVEWGDLVKGPSW